MNGRQELEKGAFLKALGQDRYDEATHRAFADWLSEHGLDDEAEYHRLWTPERQAAEDHLRKVASECEMNYDAFMKAVERFLDTGHQLGLPMNVPEEDHDPAAFWASVEVLTGRGPASDRRDSMWDFYFCNCGPWMEPDGWEPGEEDYPYRFDDDTP